MPQAPRTREKRPQLSAFIAAKRATDDRGARRRSSSKLSAARPTGLVFSPERHGLSWAQCQLATELLHRANQRRPLQGSPQAVQFRYSLRVAGIVSAVRHGRVRARGWGKRMLATKGGNAMRDHAPDHLRRWGSIARLASRIAHEGRQAAAYWERTGEVLPIGAQPAESPEESRIQDMTALWEAQQWQTQRDRLQW